MASGRMLNKKIGENKDVDNLSSDTCRLAFSWTIPHLDRDGRVHGDPYILKNKIFPRRKDITEKDMEKFIQEWVREKLVTWYEANGDKWLQFPGFRGNQPNLRYERERPSSIPPPEKGQIIAGSTPAEVRQDSDNEPDRLPPNLREGKLIKENSILAPPAAETAKKKKVKSVKISENRHIYHLIENAFVSKNQDFNYKREGPHILELETKALARASPEDFIKKIIVVFWQLTRPESSDRIFKKQPFLPSILNSGGLWPRVLKELGNREEQLDPEISKIIERIFHYDSK